jgi:hypothetical protein
MMKNQQKAISLPEGKYTSGLSVCGLWINDRIPVDYAFE